MKTLNIIAVNGLAHCRSAARYTLKGSEGIRLDRIKINWDGDTIDVDYDEFMAVAEALKNAPTGPLLDGDETLWLPDKK